MKRTWEAIPKKTLTIFEELKEIMKVSGNWKNYRDELKNCNPPCLPYLGFFFSFLLH